jgi:hypothetical protein
MESVHFLDLEEHAVRGPIERGLIYYYCHPQIGDFKKDWYPTYGDENWTPVTAQAYPILTTSGVLRLPRWHFSSVDMPHDDPYWGSLASGFYAIHTLWGFTRPQWHYATDSGLRDVPGGGSYRNYMLDKNALLRQGIIVDLSRRVLEDN